VRLLLEPPSGFHLCLQAISTAFDPDLGEAKNGGVRSDARAQKRSAAGAKILCPAG
jgi:hypothetical protein